MVRQRILRDTSARIQLEDDEHGVAELSAPLFLKIYSSVLTVPVLSLKISRC